MKKNLRKIFKNLLTKFIKCDIIKKVKEIEGYEKKFKKIFKNPLTKFTKYAIIKKVKEIRF